MACSARRAPASPQLPSKRGRLWSLVSVTARNGRRPHPGGTTWISNRSRMRRGDDLAAGQVKRILRDGLPDGVTGRCARLEQPVRDDHPPRQPADPDRRRGAGQQEAPLRRRRLRPDQERQAAQVHPPERNITRLIAKNVHTGVAGSGQVYWLIARHASDRRARGRADPSRFPPRERSCTSRMRHAAKRLSHGFTRRASSAASPGLRPDEFLPGAVVTCPRHADGGTAIPARNSMMLSRSQSPRIKRRSEVRRQRLVFVFMVCGSVQAAHPQRQARLLLTTDPPLATAAIARRRYDWDGAPGR